MALAGSQTVEIQFWKTSRMLLLTVVGPVVGGYLLHRRFPQSEAYARAIGSTVANLSILWIIAAVVGRNRESLMQFQHAVFIALLLVNLGGYTIGYAGGWLLGLPSGMRRALTLEVGMQNAGLGATLATQLFPDRAAIAIAPAMYTFGCMLTGTMLARIWATFSQNTVQQSDTP
jgi:BASS family bile acid:Na+ symporter